MALVKIATSNMSGISDAAVQLPSVFCVEGLVQAHRSISASARLLVGNLSGQYISLSAGDAFVMPVSNLNEIYVQVTGGSATVNWFAMQGHPHQ